MGFIGNFEIWSNQRPKVCNFDLEDSAGTYRDCNDVTIPTVDNSTIECEELISTNCVVTAKSYNFFGIGVSETVTSAIDKIMTKMKAINEKSLKTGRGVAVFTQLTEPTQTDFNTEYGSVDGFGVNKITGANTFRPGDIWIEA